MKRLILCAALGAGLMVATEARASVTVIGGGLAEACSKAALGGQSEYRYEAACTQSIEQEQLSNRDRAGTFVNRGILKLRRLDYAAATKDFDKAVRVKPDLGEAYVNRGAASIGQHRYADGLSDLNKGLQLGIEEPAKAYYNRAIAYEGLDDIKSAYFDYQKAVELSPDWPAPKAELARFHVQPK
ncbi:tetratricopeptide repeat protein [Phenylobacterium sp.]|jgi:tetratricopeptide (TPR) repeat protein|uniref:tetratricopeptide repeat protein n=1 Tax=Phenylobacterium sp. TaxID=1871053 RepID=UPI002E35D1F8|nr:tetratricopeptide repeat protein [Phenylobacterium sp.]HEX4711923.1 tetratricopeptide repeat protein [Phenylobacterium sp.]